MNTYLGEPERRTDFESTDLQDITGFGPDDLEHYRKVAAALIYRGAYFILEYEGGEFWTIMATEECLGTVEECEAALETYVRGENGEPAVPYITLADHTAYYLGTWDGDLVELHTAESLHSKYDSTNLFDEDEEWREWTPRAGAIYSKGLVLTNLDVGDSLTCGNCEIRRIK